jgi:hypothetical protein
MYVCLYVCFLFFGNKTVERLFKEHISHNNTHKNVK